MINVNWDNHDHNILVWKFITPWTFEEFFAAQKQANVMVDSVEGHVDSIFLTTTEQKLPVYGLSQVRKIITQQHPRHRYIVVVGANAFLAALLKVLTELVPNLRTNLYYVRSQDEAYTVIDKKRGQLLTTT